MFMYLDYISSRGIGNGTHAQDNNIEEGAGKGCESCLSAHASFGALSLG